MIQRPRQSFHLSLSYNQYQLNGSNLQDLTIEEYKVLKELGRGSFGKVYKAIDERGKYFALKLLDKKQAREEKSLRTKEIRQKLIESQPKLMQQCNSPNVIKCFDIYENEDLKILIMQYCNGVSLTDELKQRKRFTEREAVQILRHIINGVAELHRNSIVHRDLKTDNIMKHDGVYKIIDFGFSKKLQLSYEDESSKNTILGTPTNMAPQVVYRKNYGLKADIWSIGIIFFQMIFGVTPYDLSTAGSFFKNIEKTFARIEPIFYRDANLSSQGQDFLRRVLKINPDERISWREMIEHPLTKIKDCQPLTSRFIERYDMVEPQVPKQLSEGSLVDRYDIVEPLASKLVVAEPFVQRQKVKVESLVHNQMAEVEPIAQRLIVEAQPLAKRSLVQVDPQISNQPIELEKYEITEYQRQKQQAEGSLAEKRLSQLTIRSLLKNSQIKPALSIIQTKLQEQPKFIKSSQNESKDDKPKKQRFDLDRLIQLEKQAQVKRKQLDEQEQLKRELAQQKPSIPMYPQQSQIRSQTFSKNQPKQPRAYSEIENSIIQQQNPQYRKCLVYHLECLKTQLIYEKIIEPIQSRSLLDFGQRESIQFMYLLISRCFKNLSPLKQMMKNSKNLHSSFNNLNLQIQRLYYNVAIKFKQYDERLLQLENKLFQMAKDFFSKIFSSDQQQRKNKMIGGVEIQQFTHENHIKKFGDFIKAEQIEFTSQYIQQILPKLLEIGSYTSKIKRYLQFYTPIMNITLESLGDQTFSDYVERIIS